ncbi:10808_t:CDS:2 [Acaulospora colombiana]|uniref:10808_t:CDS:1 n=1 Tax=Acaulospora colombiana TaxID=27376 RepID=A0ACA9LF76_9GLOM|nr:10808_t:CDS:2 [Acaulospora colombiana]
MAYTKRSNAAWNKAFSQLDRHKYPRVIQQEKYIQQKFQNNRLLTKAEKDGLLARLHKHYDLIRIERSIEKRLCTKCIDLCSAAQYCELCVRKYLENNFRNWSSGNSVIDKLIQECQKEVVITDSIVEWIEYEQFEDVTYKTEGGCSKIYTAIWRDGPYHKWNDDTQSLQRFPRDKVVLKKLCNSANSDGNWFQEVKSQFCIDNTGKYLVRCYGLTKDPICNDYLLVLNHLNCDLRQYLAENYSVMTWDKKYDIIRKLSQRLSKIHQKNFVHRDLHSGNILYSSRNDDLYIGDMGFCGPIDKQIDNVYGNIPYIAPEVLCGEPHTQKSDVYSLGILMWQIAVGRTPFRYIEYNDNLVSSIVGGIRPDIHESIPFEYVLIMKQCWDADPKNRPDACEISNRLNQMLNELRVKETKQRSPQYASLNYLNYFINKTAKKNKNYFILTPNSETFTDEHSKLFIASNMSGPKNATIEEQLGMIFYKINFLMGQRL